MRQRQIVRWAHIALGALIATYVYSPWSSLAGVVLVTKAVILPGLVASGLWLWQGQRLLGKLKRRRARASA